jgi:hypothetical protein
LDRAVAHCEMVKTSGSDKVDYSANQRARSGMSVRRPSLWLRSFRRWFG